MVGVFLAIVLLSVLAALVMPRLLNYLEVDRCLDAGGAFNYENGICEVEQSKEEGNH